MDSNKRVNKMNMNKIMMMKNRQIRTKRHILKVNSRMRKVNSSIDENLIYSS